MSLLHKSKLPNNCFTKPFTSLSLRKCPNVAHEPQYCNLRKTAVANIDTICKAQAIAQPPWPIAQITHDARCKRAHHNKEKREQASSSLTAQHHSFESKKPPTLEGCLPAADGEQARNASALKWDTHLPAHVSWLEAWLEAEKQPSHARRRRSPALPAEL